MQTGEAGGPRAAPSGTHVQRPRARAERRAPGERWLPAPSPGTEDHRHPQEVTGGRGRAAQRPGRRTVGSESRARFLFAQDREGVPARGVGARVLRHSPRPDTPPGPVATAHAAGRPGPRGLPRHERTQLPLPGHSPAARHAPNLSAWLLPAPSQRARGRALPLLQLPCPATASYQPLIASDAQQGSNGGPVPGPLGSSRRPCPGPGRPRHAFPDTPHLLCSPGSLESMPCISGSQNVRPRGHPRELRLALADAGARWAASGFADTRRAPCCVNPLGHGVPRGCGAALLQSESARVLLVQGTFSLSLYKCVIFLNYKSKVCLL